MADDDATVLFAFIAPGCQGPSFARPAPRDAFLRANGTGNPGDLTMVEATAIADAVGGMTQDNFWLRDEYYKYYADSPIHRLTGQDDSNAIAQNQGANTNRGNTTFPSDIQLTPAQPPQSMRAHDGDISPFLGTVMIHEYAHVEQSRDFSAKATYASENEAIAYGVEYFFAMRFNNSTRAMIIMDEGKPWFWDNGTWIFCKWFLILKWCYEIIDAKRTDAKPWEAAIAANNVIRYGDPDDGWKDGTAKKAKAFAEALLKGTYAWQSSWPPDTINPGGYGVDKSMVLSKMRSICAL